MTTHPVATAPSLARRRLDAADLRQFSVPGSGRHRRRALTDLTLDHLRAAWVDASGGRVEEGLALAGVGSLARGDGGPLSDLDLVLLHDGRQRPERVAEVADRMWYPLWGAGLRLDHAVRTLTGCREVAGADLVAAIGLLDIEVVAGDAQVVAAVRSTILRDWRANARRRLPDLLQAVEERHARAGDLPHLLEPDLKESRGGLRDMALLRSLATAWLADRPHGAVDAAYDKLLDVRDALHVGTAHARGRLVRAEHDAVAALLGYPRADALLIDVAEAGRTIAQALEATTRRAAQSQRARGLRVGPRRPRLTPLGHGLFNHDGEVVLGSRVDPGQDPLLLLRAAEAAARAGLPIAPQTVDNLAASAPPIPVPWPAPARELFGDLLATGEGLPRVWEALTLAGVIETWLPQWSAVRSLPQHSPVHRHTVDRHQVQTVVEARVLLSDVCRPDLLLLGALLHDLGKAHGAHDHARLGAAPAREVVRRLGHRAADADLVARLVAEHLTLVDLATRCDLADPATTARLLEAVEGDGDVLDLLRALTEADARSAGPQAWTPWRARLVDDLCERARDAIGGTCGRPGAPTVTAEVPAGVRAAVASTGVDVWVEDHEPGQVVEVVAADRVGLFADVAGVLAAHGLTVRSAALRTVDGLAVDRWYVESTSDARADAEQLRRGLVRLARGDRGGLAPLWRRHPLRAPDGPPVRALLVTDASDEATVVQLRAPDRAGLLHDVGRGLAGAGVSVLAAQVSTSCGQAVDTVHLLEPDGSRLTPARVAEAVGVLIDAAEGLA